MSFRARLLFMIVVLLSLLVKVEKVQDNIGVVWSDSGNTLNVLFLNENHELEMRIWDLSEGERVEVDSVPFDNQLAGFSQIAYAVGRTAVINPFTGMVDVRLENDNSIYQFSVYGKVSG